VGGGASGRVVRVPATVGTSAYRIVQESLTNAGRHAPGAAVTVHLDRGRDALRIEVLNGPGEGAAPGRAGQPGQAGQAGREEQAGQEGHGLVGMRERVTMLGGTLEAGPVPGGGFRVAAVLPLTGGAGTGAGGVSGGVPGAGTEREADG
jgi:signal transduction histidine kinase